MGKKIQSVDKALQILDFLSSSRYGFGTTTIAEELGMSPATVSRILQTLMQREFVEQTENQRYRLGMRFIHIGIEILRRIDIRAEARPFLKELAKQYDDLAILAIRNHNSILCIEKAEGKQPIQLSMEVGTYIPYTSAFGKAILVGIPNERLDELLDRIKASSEGRNLDKAVFLRELAEIRKQGYALKIDEGKTGFSEVAVPIFDYNGNAIASIGIFALSARNSKKRLSSIIKSSVKAANSISHRLGAEGILTQ
ncbi:MAG: IclR family transcriptional regulator [Firmicutes bacterium]|nr:IclR family transcriptional regulator [Bacillota bacterium]